MANCSGLVRKTDLEKMKRQANFIAEVGTGETEQGQQLDRTTNPDTGKSIATVPATIRGIDQRANEAIQSYKLRNKGNYLPNPVTLEDGFEYVRHTDGKDYFAVNPPYTTNPTAFPDPTTDTNLVAQSYVSRGALDATVNNGDSRGVGGKILPVEDRGATVGEDISGATHVKLIGGNFTELTRFPIKKKDRTNTPVSGAITNINLTTRPYSATIGTDDVWLLDIKSYHAPTAAISLSALWLVGDGVADDTAVWKAAAESLDAMDFPSSKTKITETIMFTRVVKIHGNGIDSVIVPSANFPALWFRGGTDYADHLYGIDIDGIAISHTGQAGQHDGIVLENVFSSTFNRIWAEKCNRVFVQCGVFRSTFSNMFDMTFVPARYNRHWFYADADSTEYPFKRETDNTYDKLIAQATEYHFYLQGNAANPQDGVNIVNCVLFKGNDGGKDNIYIRNGYWCTINGNKLFEPSRHGLYLVDCAHVTIDGNLIAWAGQDEDGHGIYCASSSPTAGLNSDITITGGTISSPSGNGIKMSGTKDFTIGNVCIPKPNARTRRFANPPLTRNGITIDSGSKGGVINPCSIGAKDYLSTALNLNSVDGPRSWLHDIYVAPGCSGIDISHENFFDVKCEGKACTLNYKLPIHGETGSVYNSSAVLNRFDSALSGWTPQGFGAAVPTITANQSSPFDNEAVKIDYPATGGNAQSWALGATTSGFFQGNQAMVSMWLRADTDRVIIISIFGVDDDTRRQIPVRVDNEWKRYYFAYELPANYNSLNVRIGSQGSDVPISIYAYGAKLEQGVLSDTLPSDYHLNMKTEGQGYNPPSWSLWSSGDTISVTKPVSYASRIYTGTDWVYVAVTSAP